MADDHGLDTQLPERVSFAVHLHRLLSAEDSTEMTDEDEEGRLVLRDLRQSGVVAVQILDPRFGHGLRPLHV